MEKRREILRMIGFVSIFGNGIVCTALSLFLTGAGHGWMSPVVVSWISLVACPVVAATAFMRGTSARIAAIVVVAVGISADFMIWKSDFADPSGFTHVWSVGASFVVAWMTSWFSWQTAAALIAVRTKTANVIVTAFAAVSLVVDFHALYLATLLISHSAG